MSTHFRKEEEVLIPVLARYGGDPTGEPLAEMLAQHARIRGLVMQLSDEARSAIPDPRRSGAQASFWRTTSGWKSGECSP